MKLLHSFPTLDAATMLKVESILKERFDYPPLPEDYKAFLMKNNGGYVSPGYYGDHDDEEHTSEVFFETPLKWARNKNKPVTPCVLMFFVVWLKDEMNKEEVTNWELYSLIDSNHHSRVEYEILPLNMMSIAKCSHPDSADMLCLSLDESDYGAVYYTYDMWYYPAKFHGDFYINKKKAILKKYKLKNENAIDLETKEGKAARFELDRVPFVKVADSFSDFLDNLTVRKIEY